MERLSVENAMLAAGKQTVQAWELTDGVWKRFPITGYLPHAAKERRLRQVIEELIPASARTVLNGVPTPARDVVQAFTLRESRGQVWVVNDNPDTGDYSWGPNQINLRGPNAARREEYDLTSASMLLDLRKSLFVTSGMSSGFTRFAPWAIAKDQSYGYVGPPELRPPGEIDTTEHVRRFETWLELIGELGANDERINPVVEAPARPARAAGTIMRALRVWSPGYKQGNIKPGTRGLVLDMPARYRIGRYQEEKMGATGKSARGLPTLEFLTDLSKFVARTDAAFEIV